MAEKKKKKKSKLLWILVAILLVIAAADGAFMYHVWYQQHHIFVEDAVYAIDSQSLDLRESDISFEHYAAVHSQLPDCSIVWNVPFQGGHLSSDSTTVTLKSITQEDIDLLVTYFPALRSVDALACRDYEMIEVLKAALPEAKVDYKVSLGGVEAAPDVTELELNPGDYTVEELAVNLRYLHELKTVLLHKPEISALGLDALKETYADVAFTSTVDLLGTEYDASTTELDLSGLAADQVQEACDSLSKLPNLAKVELCKDTGESDLTKEQARDLIAAAPNAVFHYSFDFYGTQLSTDTEEVHITNKNIGDAGEAEVRLALDLLSNCKKFTLENCRISNDIMAQIREDYRGKTKVVWRIYFGKGSSLTDAQVIRCTYDLVDDNCHDLVYCEDARFMDIGHDEYLDGIDFISGMTNLEYVIISGSPIKDLSPLANCKKLKVLEVAFCMYLEDLSPLAGCESLEMLNIAQTAVTDLSPLDNLPLKTLCAKQKYKVIIPAEEQQRFIEKHPDCLTQFEKDGQPYGVGWRYDSNNKSLPWYKLIAKAFKYPDPINNFGWYFDENE